jgi:hypothetical protein
MVSVAPLFPVLRRRVPAVYLIAAILAIVAT